MQTSALKTAMAAAYAAQAQRISLHTDDPGFWGDSEATYSGYARQTPGAATAGDAGVITTGEVTFAVPDGTTITHVGVWTAAGVFHESRALTEPLTEAATAKVSLTFTYDEVAL